MNLFVLVMTPIAVALIAAGCNPGSLPTPQGDLPYSVIAAEQELSKELGIPVDEIDYVSFSREDWPDACLGLAEPDEMCAQVITPGWRVVLMAEGAKYVYRTDASGEVVRQEE
jgi:hypothetical protein